MPSKNITTRRLTTQLKSLLTNSEVQRIADKLAIALEHKSENIALITLLFDYLETVQRDSAQFSSTVYDIKKYLFVGTNAADSAQEQFQADAYKNRGKLLQWPSERKGDI